MRSVCLVVLSVILVIGLIGCQMSKPYVMKMDRVDQKIDAGNRGYLKGTPPPPKDRGNLKRPFIAIDIDLPEIEGTSRPAEEGQQKEEQVK